jgi:hypothetical protein
MRTKIGSVVLLAGMMGVAAEAAAGESDASVAGKRGLSPIIVSPIIDMLSDRQRVFQSHPWLRSKFISSSWGIFPPATGW